MPPVETVTTVTIVGVVAAPADDVGVIIKPPTGPATTIQALPAPAGTDGGRAPSREEADKGKALAFTTDYSLDTSFEEDTIALGMCLGRRASTLGPSTRRRVGEDGDVACKLKS